MKSRILLSLAAAADLDAIDDETIERFGPMQARRTAKQFQEVFQNLAAMP